MAEGITSKLIDQGIIYAVNAVKEITPWVAESVGTVSPAFPVFNVLVKFIPELIKEKDPLKQGYYACTLAYSRAVEQVFKKAQERKELNEISFTPTKEILDTDNPTNIDMFGFTLEDALSHPFINHADTVLKKVTDVIGIDATLTSRLIKDIHWSFLRQLRLLLIHPQTAEKFEAFRNLIALDNSQFKLQKVLCSHGYYQSWLYIAFLGLMRYT
ncbi:MAG: hypothetical protein QNJ64_20695 [Crocosphaera sp.]|nr:hypothetical protein [Crocosphaera sp.]